MGATPRGRLHRLFGLGSHADRSDGISTGARHVRFFLPAPRARPYTGCTVNWDTFLTQVQGWLDARKLLLPGTTWVVGLSGGPDSTLLLHALRGISDRAELRWKLVGAHFHHGLRGEEADADERFVAELVDHLGGTFRSERIDIRAAVAEEGGSTEEVARTRRYDFLERVALQTGSELVTVAHHADDNAETVLHRICRGTGLRGLAGIHEVRPIRPNSHIRLVRPLLTQRRETIEELCAAQGFQTRTDSTNRSPEFTRGRIRYTVMPMLREMLNPQVADALLRLSEHARWLGNYLEDAAARTFESLVISEGSGHLVLNTRGLLGKQKIIQAEVIRRALALIAPGEQDLSFGHIDTVLRLAEDPGSGKEVHLPGPVLVRKQYDRLEFRPLASVEPPPDLGTVFINCPGRTALPMLGMELSAEICEVSADRMESLRRNTNRMEEWLDFELVQPPLLVRGRRDGDRFRPLGAQGTKTVGDFFTEQKVDPDIRQRTGLLCDQEGVLWVMPLRIDERAKLRPRTRRALHLVLTTSHKAGPPTSLP
jgi:tRNA(Ile)-lysidine synthase